MPSPTTTYRQIGQNNGPSVGLPHNGAGRRPSGLAAPTQEDRSCT